MGIRDRKNQVEKTHAVFSIDSWTQYLEIIETHFLDWPEYIYRGQGDARWPLRSNFDRRYREATKVLKKHDPLNGLNETDRALVEQSNPRTILDQRDKVLERQLDRFQRACCGRRGVSPKDLSTDEWWALGRHYGLATPLLDWARSPYVACFFAMSESSPARSGKRAVWAFSYKGMRDILVNQPSNMDTPEYDVVSIELVDANIDENSRILSQGGLFTRTPGGADIETFISENLNLTGISPVLYRVEIPENQREAFLRHLEAMNIHHGSLFPDLVGAADFSNRGLEKEWSEILWQQKPDFIRRMLTECASHE